MMDDMSTYRKTRWPSVFYRGDVLYYRVRRANGKSEQIRYGEEGTPADAAQAQQLAQAQENKIKAGLLDAREAAINNESVKPISEVLDEYAIHLRAKGNTDTQHGKTTRRYIERCVNWCGFKRLRDFDAGKVDAWLEAEFRKPGKKWRAPAVAVKGLMNWATAKGKLSWNPLAALKAAEEQVDRPSRALSREEYDRLIGSMTNKRRIAFYRIAAETGLRWREIARLTWGCLDMDNGAVLVQNRKGRRMDALPMPDTCIAALLAYKPRRGDLTAKVFPCEPRLRTWKQDLEAAGIAYETDAGQADRKCLRMTYCTWLYKAGVDLRDAQRLMRHKDPKLTAKIYTDIRLDDLRAAQSRAVAEPEQKEKRA